MKLRLMFFIVLLLLPALIVSGCNNFGWTSGKSADSLIEEGQAMMRDADYSGAAAKFAEAMAEDPNNSDARYYHAKATVHASGYNALNLADIISDSEFADGDPMPFIDWTAGDANKLFQVMQTVSNDLTPIYNGQTTGGFGPKDVDIDLGLASGFLGILGFQDTDNDGAITADDVRLNIEYVHGDTTGFSIANLLEYYGYYNSVIPKLTPTELAVVQPIPDTLIVLFNIFVDNIEEIINNAIDIIMDIAVGNYGVNPMLVNDVLDEIIQVAHMYKVEIGVDNDGDGSIDEEVVDGLDNDGDGLIDEDSDGTWDPDLII